MQCCGSPDLTARADAFIALNGRRPEQADLQADPAWWSIFTAKKAHERETAVRQPGGCSVYIVRRRRFCSHAAADGLGGLCSEHAAASAAAASEPTELLPSRVPEAEAAAGSRKRNLKRRMKRMTNPLASRTEVVTPDWSAVFADAALPALLDIGCAKGRFLAELATDASFQDAYGAHNLVGVEIFCPLAEAANKWRDASGLRNLHYVGANANASLQLLSSIPNLRKVCVQFPDPWKDDNAARRVVTPQLAAVLASALPSGGEVFLVSDVRVVAEQMRDTLLANAAFKLHARHLSDAAPQGWGEEEGVDAPEGGWLRVRPYGVPTERDKVCEAKWRPIYRTLLTRV